MSVLLDLLEIRGSNELVYLRPSVLHDHRVIGRFASKHRGRILSMVFDGHVVSRSEIKHSRHWLELV